MNEPTKERPIIATSSRIAYENPWIKIREDKTLRQGGQEGIYGVVETNDSVVTCALNSDNELFLIYGYSYPTDTWSWQVPGGGGDGESPVDAARRELLEETGLLAGKLEQVSNLIVSCGLLKEKMAVVIATELSAQKKPESDDFDSIRGGKFVSLDGVRDMIARAEICDSQSISAIYLLERWLEG